MVRTELRFPAPLHGPHSCGLRKRFWTANRAEVNVLHGAWIRIRRAARRGDGPGAVDGQFPRKRIANDFAHGRTLMLPRNTRQAFASNGRETVSGRFYCGIVGHRTDDTGDDGNASSTAIKRSRAAPAEPDHGECRSDGRPRSRRRMRKPLKLRLWPRISDTGLP